MLIDHAMRRLYQVVKEAASGATCAWGHYQAQIAYPWVSLQVISGPNTERQQRIMADRQEVTVTVLPGAASDMVSVGIGGRYLALLHDGDEATTATALSELMPAHWTVGVAGAVITVTGDDVFYGEAYLGATVALVPVGDTIAVNCHRRDCLIQIDVWVQLDRTGRPQRWEATGADSRALAIRDALWDIVPDPWRVYMRPSDTLRPFQESFADGKEYQRTSFDVRVSWLDIVAERQFGDEVSTLEEAVGTISTSDDGVAYVIEDFVIDETLDP